jgi:hypothetical protein
MNPKELRMEALKQKVNSEKTLLFLIILFLDFPFSIFHPFCSTIREPGESIRTKQFYYNK